MRRKLFVTGIVLLAVIFLMTFSWLHSENGTQGGHEGELDLHVIDRHEPPNNSRSRASTYKLITGPNSRRTDHRPQRKPNRPTLPSTSKWIWLWSENNTQLWGETAYIDKRVAVHGNSPVAVLFGFRETRQELMHNFAWFCHTVDQHTAAVDVHLPHRSSVCTGQVKIDPVEYQFANNHGWSVPSYFICPLNGSTSSLLGVYLSGQTCDSKLITPMIPIKDKVGRATPQKTVGICLHKALFDIHDPQLVIQFIEMHKFFGVELFTIYIQDVSAPVRDILYGYAHEGLVDLIEWKINISMDVRDFGQVAVIHECLYRNRNRVKYLGFLDIDELFVPHGQRSLSEVLRMVDRPNYGSLRFMHVFLHETPSTSSWQHLLSCPRVHLPVYFKRYLRSDHSESHNVYDALGSKTKVFVKPEAIVRMGRHSMRLRPIHKFAPGFTETTVPGELGLLHHYRPVIDKKYERRPLVQDQTLVQFQELLMNIINAKLCVSKK